MPPSTKLAPAFPTVRPTLRAVSGEIAFASTKIAFVSVAGDLARERERTVRRAYRLALCPPRPGRARTEPRSSSPAAIARERVARCVPEDAHTTLKPRLARHAPIAEPNFTRMKQRDRLMDMAEVNVPE